MIPTMVRKMQLNVCLKVNYKSAIRSLRAVIKLNRYNNKISSVSIWSFLKFKAFLVCGKKRSVNR